MSLWISMVLVWLSAGHSHHQSQCECERAVMSHRITGTSLAKMAANGDNLIITEIMQNPAAVSDTSGEWFEVFNPGSTTVNMNGWIIRDNGSDSHLITTDVLVPALSYIVLGRNSNFSTNGGITVHYQYTSISLANADDEIILVRPDTSIANEVRYTGSSPWPDPTGASMELSSAAVDNSIASNWSEATEVMLSGDKGTPGTGPDLVETIIITEIMQNPSVVSDTDGEWFEIHNPGGTSINLNGWTIKDAGTDTHTITSDFWIAGDQYAVLGRNANSLTNGGISVDYQYAGITLANSADEIIIDRPDGSMVDEVWYTGTNPWPNPTGASMELNSTALDNNIGSNWSVSTVQMNEGDFGTPGSGPGGSGPGGNQVPVVDAGPGRTIYLETAEVTTLFSGVASDPDGDPLTSQWALSSGNAIHVTIASPATLQSNVSFSALGSYTFELTVSDGLLNATDTLVVIVAERPVFNGEYQIYYGNLHAHSAYSDGNKGNDAAYNNVADSFRYARDYGGLDWLLMADHNHGTAGMAIADYHSGAAETAVINAESGLFTAIYGMEWGTISSGGHIIMASNQLWGWEVGNYDILTPKGDYNTVFQQINNISGFGSLCHPNSGDFDNIFNSSYNASWDNAVSLVAIKSGPAFSTATDYSDPSNSSYLSYYHHLLLKGYHIAPGADQDTHYANWGLANEQRTAVMAVENTQASILEALTAGRCYAVEDRNIQLNYTATTNGETSIMSSVLSVPVGNAVLFDVEAIDTDGETITSIELFSGTVGGASVSSVTTSNNAVLQYSFTPQTQGETSFFYIVATESDGQRAWSAPIWVEGTTGQANLTPTAGFSYITTDLSVSFTDSSSDPDGQITQWNWNFGDGTSATTQNPTHTYITTGNYNVTLTVTDNQGATASHTATVAVSAVNVAPTADFSFTTTDLSVSFTDLSTDSDGSIVQWSWNFGDGTASATQNPGHVFSSAGNYNVMLMVTDNLGATGSYTNNVSVSAANMAPSADFSYSSTDLTVQFTDLSNDVDGQITQWAWSFGDGNSATSSSPNHTYGTDGTYQVTLTVTDDGGVTDSMTQSIAVTVSGPVIVTESATDTLSRYASHYYDINVSGGMIDLTCTFGTKRKDLDLYIYDSLGALLAFSESTSVPETLTYDTQGVAGTYTIEVYNAERRTTSYTLEVTYQQ